jgi:DNA-binding winged helix-turn-helix (wHTH) protein
MLSPQRLQLAEFELDTARFSLSCGAVQVSQDDKLLRLLTVLAAAYPQPVSKQELLDAVWGDVVVSEASLAKLVSEGRRLLRTHAPEREIIKTIHGRGYRLGVEPVPMDAEPVAAGDTTARSAPKLPLPLLGIVALLLVLIAVYLGARVLGSSSAPTDITGRWLVVNNNVVVSTQINSDDIPYCVDSVEYLNARLNRRDGVYTLDAMPLQFNLGTRVEYGKPITANISYREGTGITHTQLHITFESPTELTGHSEWTWEVDGVGELCKGISSLSSER